MNDYAITRTFTAEDACGNTATATQRVTYTDTGLPAWTFVPAAATLECSEAIPTSLATAEDGCDGALEVTVSEVRTVGACAGTATVTRTFAATDADGNRITATQVVTVEDRLAPTLVNVPAAAAIECGAAEPTALPTATDACDTAPVVTVTTTTTAGTCAGESTLTRVFTATDACGNTASASQVVTVRDRSAPVLAGLPTATTIECGAAEPAGLPTATDACDTAPVVTVASTTSVGTCAGESILTRVFTATDACGNTATASQVITVRDRTAPVFASVPTATTIECGAAEPSVVPTASDDCDATPSVTVASSSTAGDCAGESILTRVFTATDACGNTATASQVVTIVDRVSPVFAGVPADVTLTCGQAIPTALPTASDDCDPAPAVVVAEVRADGASANAYSITRTFTATDACGNTASASQVVTYSDTGLPAWTYVPANLRLTCGEPVPSVLATAEDGCDGELGVIVTEDRSAGPCAGATVITRTFTAQDADRNAISAVQVITVEDRQAPTLSDVPPPVTIDCGAAEPTALPTVTDVCDATPVVTVLSTTVAGACVGESIVTRVFTATDACGNTATASQVVTVRDREAPILAGIPAAITLECGASEPSAVPTATDACDPSPTVTVTRSEMAGLCAGRKTILRLFTATDACGNTATATQLITVNDKTKPVLLGVPRNVTIACGTREPSAVPTASDVCDPAPVVTTVRTEVPGTCPGQKLVTRVFTAVDACGNTATASQVITVEDGSKPVLSDIPAAVTIECGAAEPTALPVATDACDGAPVVTVNSVSIAGACAGESTVTRVFTATDACGNTATASQIVTLRDRTAPTFVGVPAPATTECGAPEPTTLPTATDGCDNTPVVSVTSTTTAGACANESILTRVFTASDACGNTATASQVITILDRTAPELVAIPAAVTIECGSPEPTDVPRVSDVCDATPTVTVASTTTAGACAGESTLTRVFTATDACGNTATASQVVTIEDRTAPTLADVPAGATVECGAPEPTTLPTATDACNGAPIVSVASVTVAGACEGESVLTRVFTATDACGNTASASQVVTLRDRTAPTFTNVPADVSLTCGQNAPSALPTASDVCDPATAITVSEARTAGASANAYTITRTFTATDACGNTATAVQVATYSDTGLPAWTSTPSDISVECGEPTPTTLATAEDGCDGALVVTVSEVRTAGRCAGATTLTRTFSATDADGNRITTTQVVTVEDRTAPALTNVPAATTIECGTAEPSEVPTATDACDTAPTVTVSVSTSAGACAGESILTRVFTATDACGNTATASQVVTIRDRVAPVFAGTPADVSLTCGQPLPVTLPSVTDACDAAPALVVTEARTAGTSVNDYEVTRTFTATDACGNTATATQLITYTDTGLPVWTFVPAAKSVECGAVLAVETATAEDGCDGSLEVTTSEVRTPGVCAGTATIRRTFVATDADGNRITTEQMVTIEDRVAPVLTAIPAATTIECGTVEPSELPMATDACDPAPAVTVVNTVNAGTCAGESVLTRMFTAADACGNTATASQIVTIRDRTAPELSSVPSAITIDCGTAEPTTLPQASDACDARPVVTVASASKAGTCAGESILTRVFTATDACGNTATVSQVVTIRDQKAPVMVNIPAAATIECGSPEPTALPTAGDDCDAAPVVTVAMSTVAGACVGESILTRVFTATDACGNTATASQVVTVHDRTVPALANVPTATTIECGAAEPTTMPTASDACDATPVVTQTSSTTAGVCAGESILTRTFIATDACGNTATASQVVTLRDRTAPLLSSVPANVALTCGQAVPVALPSATDACDGAPAVTVSEARTPGTSANAYTITRTFTATDACGNSASASQVVTYTDSGFPTWTFVPSAATVACGQPIPSSLATAVDGCDGALVVSVTEVRTAGPCAGAATVTRTFAATDADGNRITAEQIVTSEDRTAPVLSAVPAAATIECGQGEPTALPTASDACGAAPVVTVSASTIAGACPGESILTRVFTATDACGNTATASQVVTILDRTAPVLANVPGATTIECGASEPTALPSATDACGVTPAVTVASTTTAGRCAGSSILTRVFTATDACGNTATASQVVTILDQTAPVLASVPANTAIECGAAEPTTLPRATDACGAAPVVTVASTTAAGACSGTSVLTRVFTATDACGNTATASQIVTITDKTAPVLVNVPTDVTLSCGQALPSAVPSASDVCDPRVAITVAELRTVGASANAYTVTRTFTATDACGNSLSAKQVVTYRDTGPPTWTFVPVGLEVACGGDVPSVLAKAVDPCDGELLVTFSDEQTAGACAGNRAIKRTFVASDADGNLITAEQLIAVVDRTAPVFTGVPPSVSIACGSAEPTALPSARDACAGAASVSETRSSRPGSCPGESVLTRVFTATDACGNTATASQVVTVFDLTAPVFGTVPALVTVDCGEASGSVPPAATDACGSVTVTFKDLTGARGCAGSGDVTRVWTATDACGNTSTVSQTLRTVDRTPPVWTSVPGAITLECGTQVPVVLAKAEDLCSDVGAVAYVDVRKDGACASSYEIVRTFSVRDDCGNAATTSQVITVRDRVAPVMTNVPADISISCDQPIPTNLPVASDACQGIIAVVESKEITAGSCTDSYVHVRVFTATDACGNKTTARQRVSRFDNTKPTFATTLSDIELSCGQAAPKVTVTATDKCDANVAVTYSEQVDATSMGCAGVGTLVRVWTATDNCGNVATMRQRVITVDRIAPVMANLPRSVTINCGSPVTGGRPTATDNCDKNVRIYHLDKEIPANCGYTIRRTWYAEDACGNSSTGVQSILVVDKDKPVFETVVKPEITVACGEAFPAVKLVARDVCDQDLTYEESSIELGAGSCPGERLVLRVFTATDDCGNQAVLSQQVTVVDRTAPVLSGVPGSMDVACKAYDYAKTQPTAADACSPKVTLKETSAPTQVNRDGKLIEGLIRTWTATDACGNSSTATQLLVFSGAAARITVGSIAGQVGSTVCAGDVVTLTAPAGGSNYAWNTGATGQVIKVRAEVTREYAVSFGGSCAGQAKVVITVAPRPTFAVAAVPKMCEGQTLQLRVDTDLKAVTWTGPLGFEDEGASVSLDDVSNMQSGYYYATATAPSGCALRDSVYVEVGLGKCAEVCDNGIDDDGDGLVDCDDLDCDCCTLTEAVLTTECRDNGTPSDPSDDVYAVYADLKGAYLKGRAFRVSGDAELGAIYAGQPVLLGIYPIGKPSVSFDFRGVGTASCSLEAQRVASPGSCTEACNITLVSATTGACVDGQYDLQVKVRYTNPRGALLINGKRFELKGTYGEATLTLPRLSCSGKPGEPLRVSFEGDAGCGASGTFDAACPDEVCLPIAIELGARP